MIPWVLILSLDFPLNTHTNTYVYTYVSALPHWWLQTPYNCAYRGRLCVMLVMLEGGGADCVRCQVPVPKLVILEQGILPTSFSFITTTRFALQWREKASVYVFYAYALKTATYLKTFAASAWWIFKKLTPFTSRIWSPTYTEVNREKEGFIAHHMTPSHTTTITSSFCTNGYILLYICASRVLRGSRGGYFAPSLPEL